MRWPAMAFGIVLTLVGLVWTLQGFNVLPGSFMTGQPFWAGAGILCLVVGAAAIMFGARKG